MSQSCYRKTMTSSDLPIFKRTPRRTRATKHAKKPKRYEFVANIPLSDIHLAPRNSLPLSLRPFKIAHVLTPITKVCTNCNLDLPLPHFNKLKRKPLHLQIPSDHGLLRTHYLRPYCKMCQAKQHKEWRSKQV